MSDLKKRSRYTPKARLGISFKGSKMFVDHCGLDRLLAAALYSGLHANGHFGRQWIVEKCHSLREPHTASR